MTANEFQPMTTNHQAIYRTPAGFDDLLLRSDGTYLTGLRFIAAQDTIQVEPMSPEFRDTCAWLDTYFGGAAPDFTPAYRMEGLTPFRREVLDLLLTIPYGQTRSYGQLAECIARRRGLARMSAQAVGGAVGWNPICLILPCHRVLGANGQLTGYGGGLHNKAALLRHEGSL